jgi:hypothetical protein
MKILKTKEEKEETKKQTCKVCGGKIGDKTHIILNDIYFCLVDNQYHFPEHEETRKSKKKI